MALCSVAVVALSVQPLLRSRWVNERRVSRSMQRARAYLAVRDLEAGHRELQDVLRLQPANADARYELATLELGTGNWELAFVEFQSLTELQPDDPRGWIGLASILVKSGLLLAPEDALDKAIAAAPRLTEARLLRGDIRYRVGRYRGACLDGEAAAAEAPRNAAAWALLVRSSAHCEGAGAAIRAAYQGIAAVGQDPTLLQALDCLRRAGCELGPAPVPASRIRAEAERHAGWDRPAALAREHWPGRLAQARQALERELRLQNWGEAERIVALAQRAWPETVFPPFVAGILELARGNTDDAGKQFIQALAIGPRSPVITAALAKTWSRTKGAAHAGDQLMRLSEHDGGFAFARSMAASAYMDGHDPGRAEAALRRGIELQPGSAAPWREMAAFYLDLDRPGDALDVCRQGLDRFADDIDLQMLLGQLTGDLGQAADAIRIYQKILSKRPDLDLIQYRLAALTGLLDDEGAAARVVEPLRSDRPSDPLLIDSLGWAQYRAGQAKRARDSLQAAVTGAPDEPLPHFHLGAVYARENRPDLARVELNAAIESPRPFKERLDATRLLLRVASGETR